MSRRRWPEWWNWELELSPHLLKRMVDRRFTEVDVRRMLHVHSTPSGHRAGALGRHDPAPPSEGRHERDIPGSHVPPRAPGCCLLLPAAQKGPEKLSNQANQAGIGDRSQPGWSANRHRDHGPEQSIGRRAQSGTHEAGLVTGNPRRARSTAGGLSQGLCRTADTKETPRWRSAGRTPVGPRAARQSGTPQHGAAVRWRPRERRPLETRK